MISDSGTSNGASFTVVAAFLGVGLVLDFDLGVDVLSIRFTVASRWIVSTVRQRE